MCSRFGIEMVPHEQEYQSQEEDDAMALLEGFQWESLMDVSSQSTSRKRSLSESSLVPPSTHSLLTSFTSEETAHGTGLSSEQQRSTASPDCSSVQENQDYSCQPEAKAQRQPEKLTSVTVKALQRSDSVLGDSSSGTEQYDGQGTGKRRRAAGVSLRNGVFFFGGVFIFRSIILSDSSPHMCRMFQVQRLLAWSTTAKGGRSNPKEVCVQINDSKT